jgi:integrase
MPIQSHDLRTTKITDLINISKLQPKIAQEYVGHTSISTTLGYLKVDQEEAFK